MYLMKIYWNCLLQYSLWNMYNYNTVTLQLQLTQNICRFYMFKWNTKFQTSEKGQNSVHWSYISEYQLWPIFAIILNLHKTLLSVLRSHKLATSVESVRIKGVTVSFFYDQKSTVCNEQHPCFVLCEQRNAQTSTHTNSQMAAAVTAYVIAIR
jgi:hypothetical protein